MSDFTNIDSDIKLCFITGKKTFKIYIFTIVSIYSLEKSGGGKTAQWVKTLAARAWHPEDRSPEPTEKLETVVQA